MSSIYSDLQSRAVCEELKALESLILLHLLDRKKFVALMDEKTYLVGGVKELAKSGQLNKSDLGFIIAEMSKGVGLDFLEAALARCMKWGLIGGGLRPGSIAFNEKMAAIHFANDAVENILHGKLFVLNKYKNSIVHLAILDIQGGEASGSGFLYHLNAGQVSLKLIITNKHVVRASGDGQVVEKIHSIKKASSEKAEYSVSDVYYSDQYDLAALVVTSPTNFPCMRLDHTFLLQDIITAGYPKVSVANENPLLFHSGQINGAILNRFDGNSYHVIDANVAPGNSGGPVLNEIGGVVGLVSLSSIGRYEDGLETHHLMISASTISEFIAQEVAPKIQKRL